MPYREQSDACTGPFPTTETEACLLRNVWPSFAKLPVQPGKRTRRPQGKQAVQISMDELYLDSLTA